MKKVKMIGDGWGIEHDQQFFLEGIAVRGVDIYRTIVDNDNIISAFAWNRNSGTSSRLGYASFGSAFILDEVQL